MIGPLHALAPGARIVVLTGYGSITSAVEALRAGAHDYLSKPVDADQIIGALTGEAARPAEPAPAPSPTLARAEWEHIQRILADMHNNISEAARRLGITRRTLQLKLKKYPPRSLSRLKSSLPSRRRCENFTQRLCRGTPLPYGAK